MADITPPPEGLRRFRLDTGDWSWVDTWIARLGTDAFFAYYNWVYGALLRLPVGRFYDITKIQPDRQELFVKFACEFIIYGRRTDYLFSDDFTRIERKEPYNEENRKETAGLPASKVDRRGRALRQG